MLLSLRHRRLTAFASANPALGRIGGFIGDSKSLLLRPFQRDSRCCPTLALSLEDAMANQMEYFAEVTEAYFDRNDMEPFNLTELKAKDPTVWMGVPVVSLIGERNLGRAGLSLLSNVGLSEFATKDADGYVDVAVKLAHDLPRLADLRGLLRERMRASPILEAAGYTRKVEAAFRGMCQAALRGSSVSNVTASPSVRPCSRISAWRRPGFPSRPTPMWRSSPAVVRPAASYPRR